MSDYCHITKQINNHCSEPEESMCPLCEAPMIDELGDNGNLACSECEYEREIHEV